jgi:hypothetical protein
VQGKTLSVLCSVLYWLKSHEEDLASYSAEDVPGFAGGMVPAEAALSSPTRRWASASASALSSHMDQAEGEQVCRVWTVCCDSLGDRSRPRLAAVRE